MCGFNIHKHKARILKCPERKPYVFIFDKFNGNLFHDLVGVYFPDVS
jgi:hypothetical protein